MNVPTWVYETWHGKARRCDVLRTLRGDGDRLAALIEKWREKAGEEVIQDAWLDFIKDDGTAWFSPYQNVPQVVVKKRFADGHEEVEGEEDTSQVTKFPFRAFLAVAEGYIIRTLAAKK